MLLRAWQTISRRRDALNAPLSSSTIKATWTLRTKLRWVGLGFSLLFAVALSEKERLGERLRAEANAVLAELGEGPDGKGAAIRRDADAEDCLVPHPWHLRAMRISHKGRMIDVAMVGNFDKSAVAVISAGSVAAARPLMAELAAQGIPSLAYSHAGLGEAAVASGSSNASNTPTAAVGLVSYVTSFSTRSNEGEILAACCSTERILDRAAADAETIGDANPSFSASLLPARTAGSVATSDALAEELGAVLRAAALNVPRVVLVGTHYDWLAVTKTALRNAPRIGGLVLIDPWLPSSSISLRSVSDGPWLQAGDAPRGSVFVGDVKDNFAARLISAVNTQSVTLMATGPGRRPRDSEEASLPPLRGALFPVLSLPPAALFPPAAFSKLSFFTTSESGDVSKGAASMLDKLGMPGSVLVAQVKVVMGAHWYSKTAPPVGVYGGDLLASIHHRAWSRGAALGTLGALRVPRSGSSVELIAASSASAEEDLTRAFLRLHALRNSSIDDDLVLRSLRHSFPATAEITSFVTDGGALVRGLGAMAAAAEWRSSADAAQRPYVSAAPNAAAAASDSGFASAALDALRAEDHLYALTIEAHTALARQVARIAQVAQIRRWEGWFPFVAAPPLEVANVLSSEEILQAAAALTQLWGSSTHRVAVPAPAPPELASLQNVALALAGALPLSSASPCVSLGPPLPYPTDGPPGGPPHRSEEAADLLRLRASVLALAGGALVARAHPLRVADAATAEPHAHALLEAWGWDEAAAADAGMSRTMSRYASSTAVASRAAVRDSVTAAAWRVPLSMLDRYGDALAQGAPASIALVPLIQMPPDVRRRVASALTDFSLTAFGLRPWGVGAFVNAAMRHDSSRIDKGDLVRVAAEVAFLSSSPPKRGSTAARLGPFGGWRVRAPPSTGLTAWAAANLGSAHGLTSGEGTELSPLSTVQNSLYSSPPPLPFPVTVILTSMTDAQVAEDAVLPAEMNFPTWPMLDSKLRVAMVAARLALVWPWTWSRPEGDKGGEFGTLTLRPGIPAPPLLRHARGLLQEEQKSQARSWAAAIPAACIVSVAAESANDVSSTVLAAANRALKRDGIAWASGGPHASFGLGGFSWFSRGLYSINSPRDANRREGDLGDAHALTALGDAVAYGPPQSYRPPLAVVTSQVVAHVRRCNHERD